MHFQYLRTKNLVIHVMFQLTPVSPPNKY
uniref:Uncharacterized protein n=1 Tax=Anguilla anguilla TaxID=7936 RepID=A0A0E9SM14_ANGAN